MGSRFRDRARLAAGVVVLVALSASGPARAQVLRQLSDFKVSDTGAGSLDDAGTIVYASSCADPFAANSRRAYQIMKWNSTTGVGSQLTTYTEGVTQGRDLASNATTYAVSISDDGQWVAFISRANPVGLNHDESLEVFVMQSDGSQLTQLTNDAAPNAYSIHAVAISGSANRVAFIADTDPLGTNTGHLHQLFVINRDGTVLKQLTNIVGGMGLSLPGFFDFSISDDGNRLVFSNPGNLTGGNLDGNWEIFAINGDGTGLRQVTSSIMASVRPALSGDGSKIAYEVAPSVNAINWDGTGQLTLTTGTHPSITDDGQFVVFSSNQGDASNNSDLNFEIWKIKSDGTLKTLLTNTLAPTQNHAPVVAGGGGRIAYSTTGAPPGDDALYYRMPNGLKVMSGTGTSLLTLTTPVDGDEYWPTITPDGTRIAFVSYANMVGSDPEGNGEIYRIEADGTALTQVTALTDGDAKRPSIASDRDTILFSSTANPLGTNAGHGEQIFRIRADGTGLLQLTTTVGCATSTNPEVAAGGSYVVFESCSNLTGGNGDFSNEIFRATPAGASMLQLTNDASTAPHHPRIDDSGTYVVFETDSNLDGGNSDGTSEIYRIGTSGTGLLRLTTDLEYDSVEADISGSGARVVYASAANPLDTNLDHNWEIFLYEPATSTRRQLTVTTGGDSRGPRISRDGAWVYFKSNAPIFETTPGKPYQPYRVSVATGVVERVGGLRHGLASDLLGVTIDGSNVVATTTDGNRAVFGAGGDWIDKNADLNAEIYLVDEAASAQIVVSKSTPTLVSWDPDPRGVRYDLIRGDTKEMGPDTGGAIDLGPVACIENDSPDVDIVGSLDSIGPPAGRAYFYLYRASQGLSDPGTYGTGKSGSTRVPGSGDCLP